jgi:menaquinone-dependent protoporphyrinogen oxidase
MRVLIIWGSKRGGTEGIARILGDALRGEGLDVELLPAGKALRADALATADAVVVGGALYGNRWHPAARRFVLCRETELRRVPVWFFSSGPLDDSAAARTIAPVAQVQTLMERVGAQGHVTFGGRLEPGARGFPASAMAKKHAGDWRRPEAIRAFAVELARALPAARPRPVVAQPGHSLVRLFLHAGAGWAVCAAVMALLLSITSVGVAVVVHALVVPIVFAAIAWHYFDDRGAREPRSTALAFAGLTALVDLVIVAGLVQRSLALVKSVGGFWLPLALIFLVTWSIGQMRSMMPSSHHAARA